MLKEFKELVDHTEPTIIDFAHDIVKIASHYHIDISNGVTQSTVGKFISRLMKSKITPKENAECLSFRKIKK